MDRDMRRFGVEPAKRFDDARLADARLPGQQHDLTFALDSQLPTIQEQGNFLIAADEACQITNVRSETARSRLFANNPPSDHRLVGTFKTAQALFPRV